MKRMIITRKSELDKTINKRTKSNNQKKIPSKRTCEKTTSREGKVTFTINGPNGRNCYIRDGSVFSSNPTIYIIPFDSHFCIEKIRNLEKLYTPKRACV